MRSSWRRSILISLILAAAMVVGLAGTVGAAVAVVWLTQPSSANPAYVKTNDQLQVRCSVLCGNTDDIWVRVSLRPSAGGSWTPGDWISMGTSGGPARTYDIYQTVIPGWTEGWNRVMVEAKAGTGGTAQSDTQTGQVVLVDNTLPLIGTWQIGPTGSGPWTDADGSTIEYRAAYLRVPVTDTSGSGNIPSGWQSAVFDLTGTGTVGATGYTGTLTSGTLGVQLSGLSSGDHWVTLQDVKDRAGNKALISIVQFKVDTKPRNVSITGTPTATYPNWSRSDATVTVNFKYTSDPDVAGSTSATVDLLEYGTTNVVATATKGSLSEGATQQTGYIDVTTPSGAADGTLYDVRLVVSNFEGSSAPVTVSGAVKIDNTAPTIADLPTLKAASPAVTTLGVVYTNSTTPDLDWGDGDDGAGVGLPGTGAYEVKVGSTSGGVDMLAVTARDVSELDDAGLAEMTNGTEYFINVRVQDALGNWSHTADPWYEGTFVFDIEGPTEPGIPTTGVLSGTTYYTNDQTPEIDWEESEDELVGMHPTDPYLIQIYDSSSVLVKSDSAASNTYTPTANLGLNDGETYTIKVKAYDALGNESGWATGQFVFDSSGPTYSNAIPDDLHETKSTFLTPNIDISDAGVGVDPDSIVWTMKDPNGDDVPGTWIPSWDGQTSTFTADDELTIEGWYTLDVSAKDVLGNSSTYPALTWSFLLDTTDPELDTPDPVKLDTYRDIGGVIYTNLQKPTIRVDFHDPAVAPAVASGFNGAVCDVPGSFAVEVYVDEAMETTPVSGSLTPDIAPTDTWGGTWIPAEDLLEGDYFVKVVITDDAGNTRNPETPDLRFIVDITPPDVGNSDAIVGFLNNNNNRRFVNTNMIEVTWNRTPDPEAEPGVPGSGLLGYWFEIHTKEEGDEYGEGDYIYSDEWYSDWFNFSPLWYVPPTGSDTEVWSTSYSLPFESGRSYGAWIKAWDMLHTGSDWFDPPFIFDPDAPTDPGVPEVQGLTGGMTNDNTPELKWAHSTDEKLVAQSGVDLYQVEITRDGTTTWDIHYEVDVFPDEDVDKADEDAALTGDFTWIVPASLADGSYTVRVRAKDVAGNYSNWTEIAAPFTIDTTPPAVPGMPVTTSPTNNPTPTWTWSEVEDDDFVYYNVYADGVKIDFELGEEPTTGSYISAELAHGLHVLEVTSVDNLGNESAKSTQGHVLVDLEEPSVPEMNPVAEWSQPGDIRFTWSASSDDTEVKYNFEHSLDGGTSWETPAAMGLTGQSYVVDAGALHYGAEVSGRVMAYDAVGNESALSAFVSTKIDDEKPEVIKGDAPAARSDQARPTWKWSATDVGSGVDYYIVTLDNELPTRIEYVLGEASFTPSSNLADGFHELKVKAIDKVGNVSVEVGFDAIEIDTTPPAVPGMPVTTSPTNNPTPTWTWSEVEDDDFVYYNVYADGVKIDFELGEEPTTGSYISAALAHGLHVLEVTSVDNLGNESAKSTAGHVFVDLNAPTTPVMNPMPEYSKKGPITFTWSASSDDLAVEYRFQYSLDGGDNWSTPVELTGQSYTVVPTTGEPLDDGTVVQGRVWALDAVGNPSMVSEASTTIDDAGPVVTITNPTAAVTTNAAKFTYEWTAIDAGCGVDYCTVVFNGGEHRVEMPVDPDTQPDGYAWTGTLIEGENTFKVWATDKLGNKSKVVAAAPIVTQVRPQIILVQPMPGAEYKINEISTIAFQVIGLIDAVPEARLNGELLDEWRIITVVKSPTMAKFYILLDSDVMAPGAMGLRITVGAGSELFIYTVDSERSGFGFGRLRPW